MRFPRPGQLLVAVLVLGLTLPGAAASQTATPSAASPPVALVRGPDPAAPRVKPHGPVFIRIFGGFLTAERIMNLSNQKVAGFIVIAGVAFPIAHREDMEIQVDVTYLDYAGRWYHPGGGQSVAGRGIGPTALYFYNFVREGRSVMPFVGGGGNLTYTDETWIREVSNPFFGPGTFESRMTVWEVSLQAAGGVQFASSSRAAFRLEGRLALNPRGPLVLVLGGISF